MLIINQILMLYTRDSLLTNYKFFLKENREENNKRLIEVLSNKLKFHSLGEEFQPNPMLL